jgi:hypothetical protein
MDRESIKRELTDLFQQSLDQAIEAVERAPDGQWIAASEWQIRNIFQRLQQQSYEKLLQRRLEAADEAAFSPGGPAETPKQGKSRRGRADGGG